MTDRAGTNSSGGVRNLLARFEAKSENTPPPSRGRSPVSSERGRSTSSRPLSKVRTSFVAVEKSGQLGPILGVRKLSEGEMSKNKAIGGLQDVSNDVEDGRKENPKTDGAADTETTQPTTSLPDVVEEETPNGAKEETPASNGSKGTEVPSETPMASKSESEETDSANVSDASPLARKSAAANATSIDNGEEAAEAENDVGSIVKGSPFEEDGNKPKVNGSPKKGPVSKQTFTKVDSPKKSDSKEKSGQSTKVSPRSKSSSAPKPATSRPTAISTKKDSPTSSKAPHSAKSGESKNSPKVSSASETPGTSTGREPVTKTTSPQPKESKSSPKAVTKDRTTAVSKSTAEGSQKSRASLTNGAAKPPATASDPSKKPPSAIGKPQPKSPPRPVRLPAAATSSTAASAAKLGGPPSRSPSRASATAAARKPPPTRKEMPTTKSKPTSSTGAAGPAVRKRVSRPSLPPQPQDPPKSRTSIAPDESFLARMMRPTAASASKVHEKVDTKSPPRKTSGSGHAVSSHPVPHAAKPKRKSEAMGEIKEEGKGEGKAKAKAGEERAKDAEAAGVEEPEAAEKNEESDAASAAKAPAVAEAVDPAAGPPQVANGDASVVVEDGAEASEPQATEAAASSSDPIPA